MNEIDVFSPPLQKLAGTRAKQGGRLKPEYLSLQKVCGGCFWNKFLAISGKTFFKGNALFLNKEKMRLFYGKRVGE